MRSVDMERRRTLPESVFESSPPLLGPAASAAAPAGRVVRPVRQGIIGWRRDMRSGLRVRFGGGAVGVCYGLVLFSVRKASGCNPYFVSKLRLLVYSC